MSKNTDIKINDKVNVNGFAYFNDKDTRVNTEGTVLAIFKKKMIIGMEKNNKTTLALVQKKFINKNIKNN